MFIKRSCEDPKIVYICLFGKRYIFDFNLKRPYVGWHKP